MMFGLDRGCESESLVGGTEAGRPDRRVGGHACGQLNLHMVNCMRSQGGGC